MASTALQTTSERLEKDRVKVRVEVPEDALAPALEEVYRRWAKEIKVPGFRKGRVPRQLIDARVGVDAVREEALRDALPRFYSQALDAEDLEAIAPPEIQIVDFDAGSPLIFEATVDTRPEIELPPLEAIEVDQPPTEVTEADIDEQLERLRDRFAELETVGRDARRGDFTLIDLNGYRHDEPVEGASAPDLLYEVGSRQGPPRLDDELEGSRPGAILKFNDTVPEGELGGEQISFTVLVKEVKAKKLPPLDDDFAKTVGEFEALDDLRMDLRTRLSSVKKELAEEQLRGAVLEKLIAASDLEPPEKLVEGEFEHRLGHFTQDLKRAGMTMADYARQSDMTELEIRSEIRAQSAQSVKAELLLEEIARKQAIEVTQDDLGREVALAAAQTQKDPQELAKELVSSGRLNAVAADIMRRKALDHVVQNVNVVGRSVDEESNG
ncbi:MAG: trigger factor [Actinomycetota bacterium]|nr:trigger factor [Actinomycetota bacterium]